MKKKIRDEYIEKLHKKIDDLQEKLNQSEAVKEQYLETLHFYWQGKHYDKAE